MDVVKEEYLDTDENEVEEAVEAAMVVVVVMVEAMEEEKIKIVKTTMEVRITIMDLIHQILLENLHLRKSWLLFKVMFGTIFVLNEGQSEGGSIIMIMVLSKQQ